MEDERRAVLERVARGEVSPAEGAAMLDELDAKAPGASPTDVRDPRDWTTDWPGGESWAEPAPPPPRGERAARIRVVRAIGTADLIGDPTVTEAVADGPHVARREGDTLVIEGHDGGFDMQGFIFTWPQHHRHPRYHHRFGPAGMLPLRVRVNPDLPLQVEAQAGRLRIQGVHAPIQANVQAGSTDIVDFRSTLDLNVQAGSVNARGRLDRGASRVRCDAGSVRIRLERGSSVRVTARTTLGKVRFDGEDERDQPWVVGSGEGTLDIDATMGTVKVMVDR